MESEAEMQQSANQEEAYPISVVGLSKAFPHVTSADSADEIIIRDFSFVVPGGQLCSIFGPNGCGKSTLLGILSGLLPFDSGTVVIGGAPPEGGAAGCVFQHFQDSLFPWRTVRGNLLFPLECRHLPKREQDAALSAFLSDFSFPFSLDSRTYELSAGQQQIVCIARALVSCPRILLLDEPFSALDFRLRRLMQDLLLKYWEKRKPTILLVTHDIDEAIFLGQRLLVLPPKPVTRYHDMLNDLPKDRRVMFTQPFADLRAQALSFLEKENSVN